MKQQADEDTIKTTFRLPRRLQEDLHILAIKRRQPMTDILISSLRRVVADLKEEQRIARGGRKSARRAGARLARGN